MPVTSQTQLFFMSACLPPKMSDLKVQHCCFSTAVSLWKTRTCTEKNLPKGGPGPTHSTPPPPPPPTTAAATTTTTTTAATPAAATTTTTNARHHHHDCCCYCFYDGGYDCGYIAANALLMANCGHLTTTTTATSCQLHWHHVTDCHLTGGINHKQDASGILLQYLGSTAASLKP